MLKIKKSSVSVKIVNQGEVLEDQAEIIIEKVKQLLKLIRYLKKVNKVLITDEIKFFSDLERLNSENLYYSKNFIVVLHRNGSKNVYLKVLIEKPVFGKPFYVVEIISNEQKVTFELHQSTILFYSISDYIISTGQLDLFLKDNFYI
ncbi:MAG: hypothetical protein AAGF07_01435 [Patescibacteria group bacterium]